MIDKNRIVEPLPFKPPQMDRRRHTRWALDRPCKMRRASSITFEPARTVNVAPGECGQSLAVQFEQPMSLDASVLDPAA